jgi:hypothetical protein
MVIVSGRPHSEREDAGHVPGSQHPPGRARRGSRNLPGEPGQQHARRIIVVAQPPLERVGRVLDAAVAAIAALTGLRAVVPHAGVGVPDAPLQSGREAPLKHQLHRVVLAAPRGHAAQVDGLVLRPLSERLGDASVEPGIGWRNARGLHQRGVDVRLEQRGPELQHVWVVHVGVTQARREGSVNVHGAAHANTLPLTKTPSEPTRFDGETQPLPDFGLTSPRAASADAGRAVLHLDPEDGQRVRRKAHMV